MGDFSFEAVPYETRDIHTSIALLSCAEINVVFRAFNVLAKYADTKDANVEFLYKMGIMPKLLELIVYSDLTILRFTLKLLGQIVATVSDAARELSLEDHNGDVKHVNYLFMTVADSMVKEYSSEVLSHVVKTALMASSLLQMGTLVTIFDVLQNNQDPDTQLNTLLHFSNILVAREASHVLPLTEKFSPKLILCYLKSKIPEIRDAAFKIIETVTSWKCGQMQELLKNDHIVETMFKVILNDDYRVFHKRSFNIILTCIECSETATYFVKSLEFLQFCEWSKTCENDYMYPAATILISLTRQTALLQVLFDFSIEDAIMAFFRTDNKLVFYKTCEGVSNMSSHIFCCKKIVCPNVIECLISMLFRKNIPIIPYHEIALKTICLLMKRDIRTINIVVGCKGMNPIMESLAIDKEEYTSEGYSSLLEILYMFSLNLKYKKGIMNSLIYKMLLQTLAECSEYSQKALQILDHYVNISEYRQHFIKFKGPDIVIRKIPSLVNEQELINILLFLQHNLLYKKIGIAFLWKGCVQALEQINDEIKESVPLVRRLLNMIYDLCLPLKFHKLGRLETTDHLTSRFYLINGPWTGAFPFLEIFEELKVAPICLIYVVDFTADVEEHAKKAATSESLDLSTKNSPLFNKIQKDQRSSILKSSSGSKASIKKTSMQLQGASETTSQSRNELSNNTSTCRVSPRINYGSISEDIHLPQYVEKLKSFLYHNTKYTLCFSHQVKLVARFVCNVLSEPEETAKDFISNHCMEIHLATLKQMLGTSIIPLGYLRFGFYCERALLFKALAEKVGISTSLVRGKIIGKNNFLYWNEIPIHHKEPYVSVGDEEETYFIYAVVDLIDNVGNLMLVGSVDANKYCGLV